MEGKVLFVDDEEKVLSSLRRSFFKTSLKIDTALGAAEGLNFLEKNSVDIVVSDVKMPEMDGISFLKQVRKLYKEPSRMILSGYVEESNILKSIATGVCFDYVTKPWEYNDLLNRFARILTMKKLLKNDRLVSVINNIGEIPHTANIIARLESAIEADESFDQISIIVSYDISVTTKILQIANSAFYGMRRKIMNVRDAISLLGLRHLRIVTMISSLPNEISTDHWQKKELSMITKKILVMNNVFSRLYHNKYGENIPSEYE